MTLKIAEIQEEYRNLQNGQWLSRDSREFLKRFSGSGQAQRLFNAINHLTETPKCKQCGINDVKFKRFASGYTTFCCNTCSQLNSDTQCKILDSVEKKYGTRDVFSIKDGRERGLEKCNNDEDVISKRKQTNQERYGGDSSFSSKEVQNKVKETVFEKYGVENIFMVDHIKQSMRETFENNGLWIPQEEKPVFQQYYADVMKFTRKNDISVLENFDKRGVYTYHLDHMYSIKQGFLDSIKAEIIGSIYNLEMLPAKENLAKKEKCSISKNELLLKFRD